MNTVQYRHQMWKEYILRDCHSSFVCTPRVFQNSSPHRVAGSCFRIPPEILSTESRRVSRMNDIRNSNTLLSLHAVGPTEYGGLLVRPVCKSAKETGYVGCVINSVSQKLQFSPLR
jgi:hypothetical protein